jgi:hypothetical protein
MRPVNLLPAGERRQTVNARRLEKSSFVVLGVLGALLVGVLFYVSTSNKINSDKSNTAKAKQRTREAEARALALGPFAQFAKVKDTRVKSVQQLAEQRFDWERLMRETALVLPSGTSIATMDASTTGEGLDSAAGPAAASSSSSGAAASPDGTAGAPSMNLTGCAKSQPDVATLMVRLRALHDVDDVTLADSEKSEPSGSSSSSSSSSASSSGGTTSDSGSGGDADCKGLFKFDVTVAFKPTAASGGQGSDLKRVPGRLGGGA